MPIYGHEKTRTMVRSVLPSRARKDAKRRKDGLHRQNRHVVDNSLRTLRGVASDVIDDYEGDDFDYEYWDEPHRNNWGGWDDIVYDRRAADHLNHFQRWAYNTTKHLPKQNRFHTIEAKLGGALGTHAMSHLSWLKYDPLHPDEDLSPFWRRNGYWNDSYREFIKKRNDALEKALRDIAHNDKARNKFNDYMRKHASYDMYYEEVRMYTTTFHSRTNYAYDKKLEKREFRGARTLNGYHDVTKFMRDVLDAQNKRSDLGYHPSWLNYACMYFRIEPHFTR